MSEAVVRRLRMERAEVVVLGGILAGYDGLARVHGAPGEAVIELVTTVEQLEVLDALLDALAAEGVRFERV